MKHEVKLKSSKPISVFLSSKVLLQRQAWLESSNRHDYFARLTLGRSVRHNAIRTIGLVEMEIMREVADSSRNNLFDAVLFLQRLRLMRSSFLV